ncbi:hypothetical protein TraAM80_05654 [Trypanosoma rangeli]|uniref:Uncharacterized protein n=1 Tax=Trypanosoma rangeli TaxID=5698 RepID=A0A3R7NB79_TRYRA|nr:uncharacterized protein TraAM80_05654 [Trypanosoma rangeli]RNF03612.1 hypothetical protein TraAM80_05654 [Trypanosoma rangeli]|eukprot:RNF03612.1 hypothetical protein TraAM80_05654 [Trypanosoma rangeli]
MVVKPRRKMATPVFGTIITDVCLQPEVLGARELVKALYRRIKNEADAAGAAAAGGSRALATSPNGSTNNGGGGGAAYGPLSNVGLPLPVAGSIDFATGRRLVCFWPPQNPLPIIAEPQ